MDESLRNASFDQATVFESGYLFGFRQVEVRDLRFRVVPIMGGGEYPAATFVERGKRKEQVVPLNRVLILSEWGHPELETSTVEESRGSTAHRAKFPAFSAGWDALLNDYLLSYDLWAKLIIDGRDRHELAPGSGPSHSMLRPTTAPTVDTDEIAGTDLPRTLAEGSVEIFLLDRFERDPRARAICLQQHGYQCQGCQIVMSDVYGPLGDNYIHVHHKVPLAEIRQEYLVDPVRDLVPVCPNCHAMIHRSVPPLPVEELADLVRRRRGDAAQPHVAADWVRPRR